MTTIPHYGKESPYTGKEEHFQSATAQLLRLRWPNLLAFHVPNGGKRPLTAVSKFGKIKMVPVAGKKMKDAGARAGVSDWIILHPIAPYHGLIIELKAKGGHLEDTQIKFLTEARSNGYKISVVWNLESFEHVIVDYLNGYEIYKFFIPCGIGKNICNCKSESECGYRSPL